MCWFDSQLLQVFFMDEAGVLCSKASGHAIDIEDEKLVLRRRRPITRPFPSHSSHPLPKFSYSEETQEISVAFSCDPNYYDSRSIDYTTSESAWKNKIFLLVSKPKRRDPNMFDVASHFVSNTLTSSAYNLFGGRPSQQTIAAEPGALAAIGAELDEDEILDSERGEEAEVDDSPDPLRRVRMITTHRSTVDDFNLVNTARNRRRWLVETISAMDARTGSSYILLAAAATIHVQAHDQQPFVQKAVDKDPTWLEKYGPQFDQPFTGPLSFSHLPYTRCLEDETTEFDIAVLGIPFDTGVTYRPGARFGPYAIRSGSRRQRAGRAFTMAWNKDPYNDGVKLIDCGDIPVNPFDNTLAVDQMEVAYSTLLKRPIATPEKANPKLSATKKGHPRIV
ncbi:hypothetical protein PQX77_007159, partial [Marasmius sp. AFHP31]